MPTTPHSAAGWRIEPPVSDPRASGAKPAATAAALPPDDPPGTFVGSCGLRVGPKAEFSVELPMANSSRFVLPMMRAPASFSRRTTVASYGGTHPSRIRDEQVVATPWVQRLSFSATGTPARGPGSRPAATASSTAAAAARASSAVTRLKACRSPSVASIAPRYSSSPDAADHSPARTPAASSRADRYDDIRAPRRGSAAPGSGRPRPAARRRAPPRCRPSRLTTSGRSTFFSGYGCEVGATSSRSRASTSAAWSRTAASCPVKVSSSSSVSSSRARRATCATSAVVMRPVTSPS